jgi:bis(5'-nucleosyl)-tetraphosphatase (symmetrical)
MATYAIGDIQGCLEPLQCLLKKIQFDAARDKLWLAGDLINRGPDSLETLRFLYNMRHSLQVVLGNHDLHFIAVYYKVRKYGNSDTLKELLQAADAPVLVNWLRQQKLLHHDTHFGYTLVHAGIPPQWDLPQAAARAREVESALQSENCIDFLAAMYGNQPSRWSDDLLGQDRLRLITNYFTRMRFCSAEGELELKTKESADSAPAGFAPWFTHALRKTLDQKIIFGHWAALEGRANGANVFALDTGCVWGGSLTALRLDDGTYFSCPCINA